MSQSKYTIDQLETAYRNYGDSYWKEPECPQSSLLGPTLWGLIPMEHSLISFSIKCLDDDKFYRRYITACSESPQT